MKLVYVAGPFRAKPYQNQWLQWQNVMKAAALALEVWKMGASAICPHTNTAFFEGSAQADVWMEGDLEQLRRCDAVLMVPGWESSVGATTEKHCADANDIPVFHALDDLRAWLGR